jgi:MinD-like ATPase involved in chromosome partitioning or flagellar assembly
VAALLGQAGKRVAVVDTDIQSPGIHVLFGLEEGDMEHSLNNYLWGDCDIRDAAVDVTEKLGITGGGTIYLIPSSVKTNEIARVLREGYDVGLLNDGFQDLIEQLELDVLLIDTHPGLNEETLLSIAISDGLAIVMRPDQQDYQGTGVTVEVARKLGVPTLLLVVNKVPQTFDTAQVKERVEEAYGAQVGAMLPHSDELMVLASAGIFALHYPDHPITGELRQLVALLMA